MNKIKIYTVIPYYSDDKEVFLNEVKSFRTFQLADSHLNQLKWKFGFTHIEITESELDM